MNLCTNCRHFIDRNDMFLDDGCNRLQKREPVRGRFVYLDPEGQRKSAAGCGPAGRFFEEKPPTPLFSIVSFIFHFWSAKAK